jgi:hypothetical protein
MLLVISIVLALVPLLGIVWILVYGSITTVDGLFMSLILLAMSGIFGLNALLEVRKRAPSGARRTALQPAAFSANGSRVERGRVESVMFFEAHVGQPNKSIVTLSNGTGSSRLLVLEGDTRNALPVGKKVEIATRDEGGSRILLSVSYF